MIFLLPSCLLCAWDKTDLIQNFSKNFLEQNIEHALLSLNEWENAFPEDACATDLLRSFCYLAQKEDKKAKELFSSRLGSFCNLYPDQVNPKDLTDLFEYCLQFSSLFQPTWLLDSTHKFLVIQCERTRFWKIKAMTGALLIGAGSVVAAINPGVGMGLISSGIPMFIKGIEDTYEEREEIQKELDRRRRIGEELDINLSRTETFKIQDRLVAI